MIDKIFEIYSKKKEVNFKACKIISTKVNERSLLDQRIKLN